MLLDGGIPTQAREKKHPLDEKEIRTIESWSRWKELWKRAETWQELLGLLHCGFSVLPARSEDCPERTIFYYDIADDYRAFSDVGGPYDQLRNKALHVLCNEFMRAARGVRESPPWLRAMFDKATFERVISFFAQEGEVREYSDSNSNCPSRFLSDHHSEVMRKFLLDLIEIAWFRFGEEGMGSLLSDDKNQQVESMFFESRPRLVTILSRLGKVDVLLGKDYRVDPASMEQLKRIALGRVYPGFRSCETIGQALLYGSRESEVYFLLVAKEEEHRRKLEIVEAERAKKEAEARLAQLADSAKS